MEGGVRKASVVLCSPTRGNLYFWASDGVLPFDPGWSS